MTSDIPHVLLIEDDVRLTKLIQEYLEPEGLRVSVEHQGSRAADRILSERPDVVVLDHMLPGEDGLTILRKVRDSFPNPILMMTARRSEVDQIVGLELGADDYVPKPVTPRLLLARIRAALRRRAPTDSSERYDDGRLVVDTTSREALIDGAPVDVTSAEFDLLVALINSAGRPVSRETLLQKLRGIEYDGFDRSIDVRVSQLRRKLQEGNDQTWIKTVRGVGYQFVPART
jgi:two-component system response regulator RstA